jgi:hypothetical protein
MTRAFCDLPPEFEALIDNSREGEKPKGLAGTEAGGAANGAALPTQHDRAPPWPSLEPDALHGLAGDVVRTIEPQTESDPVALLVQFLTYFGNAAGRHAFYQVESDRHYPNLFAVLVGQSSKSRKGTSAGRIRDIMSIADAEWAARRIGSGLSSGEGLIWQVRDPIYKQKNDESVLEDEGVADKRLLIDEREMFQALTVMKREGNTLSPIVREAWDRGDLASMTKNSPASATGAHISIIGHITEEELRRNLDHTSLMNGFANRFLYVLVRRSKFLPHGGAELAEETLNRLAARIKRGLETACKIQRVTMAQDARLAWEAVYRQLSEGHGGMLGAVCGRAEAQTIRLALVYALLDGRSEIDVAHLRAALAVWSYCEQSAARIFDGCSGDPVEGQILRALRDAGSAGLRRTQISNLFGRHRAASQIESALEALAESGKAEQRKREGSGRPAEIWTATRV